MTAQRCPECGNRLQTNYCDICMKKVPFRGMTARKYQDPWDMSSAHRSERGHQCISFDTTQNPPAMPAPKTRKKSAAKNAPKVKVIALIVAVLTLLPTLANIAYDVVDEFTVAAPEPEYNYEAYVTENVPQITPTMLYDDGEISVSVGSSGLYYDDYAVSVMIQNDADRDVTVNTQDLSVNGFMLDGRLNAHVPSGESRQAFLQLYDYALEEAGITEVAEIAFCLELYDSESYEGIATTELITLKTELAEGFTQPVDDSGWQMHMDDNLRVMYQGAEVSSYGDCDLRIYLENLSDSNISLTTNGIWINGEAVSGYIWVTLRPGTRAVGSIYIYGLEELEITQLSQITDIYMEYSVDTYRGDIITDTVYCTVSFNPNALPTSD